MNRLDLSPEYIARVTAILTRPMTALEFADAFWPNRVKRKPGIRSRAGHALLNALVRQGLARRKKSKKGTQDTFVLAGAQHAESTFLIDGRLHLDDACYWVLRLRGEPSCWLGPNDQMCETTQNPAQRSRYATRTAAMAFLWRFRHYNPGRRGEAMRLVRVSVRT
jgi:hypothetical protein